MLHGVELLIHWHPVLYSEHRSAIMLEMYCQTSYISSTLVGNKFVDHSDIAGSSFVGAAATTSSLST